MFLTSSCSRVTYKADRGTPITLAHYEASLVPFKIDGEVTFALWGLLPKEQIVNLSEEINNKGFQRATQIKVREYQSLSNFLFGVITFGFVVTKNYEITGKGLHGQR